VGMSALAEILAAKGFEVTGSDRYLDQGQDLDVLRVLRAQGVRLFPQDGSAIAPGLAGVVVSTAIEPGNPDLAAAARAGVRVWQRAERLAELVGDAPCVAVAGTSGKTTVTGMAGWVFERLGLDPTVVNGGAVLNWAQPGRLGAVRAGGGRWWVVETDESDRSFLRFRPEWAIVTNLSADHFGLGETVALFRDFATRCRSGIVTPDAAAAAALGGPSARPPVYGPESAPAIEPAVWGSRFEFAGVRVEVPLRGRHNAENALGVMMLAQRMGLDLARAAAALREFRGIQRRLECVGMAGGVTVIDEYAHNPAKIAAAWAAVAETAPRVLGVWRPHGFRPLAAMFDDLAAALSSAMRREDRLWLLPVYYAGGTAPRGRTSAELAEEISRRGGRAEAVADYDALEAALLPEIRRGDVALVMGARDPGLPQFARSLAAKLKRGKG